MSEKEEAPHIFVLPHTLAEALREYLDTRPHGEVAHLCRAIDTLRRVQLTSIAPPAGAQAGDAAGSGPANGRAADASSTPPPTEE